MTDNAPKAKIATVKGTWIRPGESLNHRLYTEDHIRGAVAEAQSLIESGHGPRVFSMLTHHGARKPENADVTRTAGRLTRVDMDERGYGTFEAELADTQAGRDVAALTVPDETGQPRYLKGVSMASVWNGVPKTVQGESGPVETSDAGFSLRGIDFTHDPGIPEGAVITDVKIGESGKTETLLLESLPVEDVFVEALITEAPNKTPYGAVTYADPGYQKDKVKRYPIDTAGHVRAAWAYINKASNAAKYSSSQVSAIKGKIKRAAKRFGIDINEELEALGRDLVESYVALTADGDETGVSLNVDGSDARTVGMAAMAAIAALDDTSDLNLDRFDSEEANSECPNCGADVGDDDNFCSVCGTTLTEAASEEQEQGGVMPEETNDKGSAPEETLLTDEQKSAVETIVAETLAKAGLNPDGTPIVAEESDELKAARKLVAEADAAKAGPESSSPSSPTPANEAAPFDPATIVAAVTESVTKSVTESVRSELIEEMRRNPQRKGVVPRSILEESPEDVYGEDPGEHGEKLRKKSLRELEQMTDDAFTPLIRANA